MRISIIRNKCARMSFYGDLMLPISKKRFCRFPDNLKKSFSFFSSFSNVETLLSPISRKQRAKTNDFDLYSGYEYTLVLFIEWL